MEGQTHGLLPVGCPHPHEEELQTITREQRDSIEIELPCPPTVAAYARYMNVVDKLDQMTRQNKSKKCMKWYRRVETKLMKSSLYNAYVIKGHIIDHEVGNVVKLDFFCRSDWTWFSNWLGITVWRNLKSADHAVQPTKVTHDWIVQTTGP